MRARTILAALLVTTVVPGLVVAEAGTQRPGAGADAVTTAQSRTAPGRVTLERPRLRAGSVVLTGRARPRVRVVLQRRVDGGWRRAATTRTNRTGRYRAVTALRSEGATSFRAVSRRRASRMRTVFVDPRTAPEPIALPEPAAPGPDACGARIAKADGGYWSCTFVDEFDGQSLDTDRWLVQETSYSGMTTGHRDCYVDDPSTIAVEAGVLLLTSRLHDEPFTCQSPYGSFESSGTAATVATRSRFTQTYGRFAFRAKFPDTAGIPGPHAALWLYPQTHSYGPWPHSGEIDVAEWFSAAPENVYPSVHYQGEEMFKSSGFDCPMPTAGTAYHTYAVEWTPSIMRFYYDGELCFEHQWTPDAPLTGAQPFDKPFYIVLSQAWGSLWNAVTAATPRSATLAVDWVRAWE